MAAKTSLAAYCSSRPQTCSFRTYRYRMPKPQKNPRDSAMDRKGVFGQGAKALRVGLYARVSTHDQQTLPMQVSADAGLGKVEEMGRHA